MGGFGRLPRLHSQSVGGCLRRKCFICRRAGLHDVTWSFIRAFLINIARNRALILQTEFSRLQEPWGTCIDSVGSDTTPKAEDYYYPGAYATEVGRITARMKQAICSHRVVFARAISGASRRTQSLAAWIPAILLEMIPQQNCVR